MNVSQPGILAPVPRLARYLEFAMLPDADPRPALQAMLPLVDGTEVVAGIGRSVARALDCDVAGLEVHPVHAGDGCEVPSTPAALWFWLRADDRGDHVHTTHDLERALAPAFQVARVIDAFQHRDSRDLSGYEDGTENPQDAAAVTAGIVQGRGAGLDGSSFVALQQWVHDLEHMRSLPQQEQDHIIGRRRGDNEELDDAPESAHVKRTAQESFTPEAFLVRRSMPWASAEGEGLVFVAFGKSFDAFAAQLNRMVGNEDGITDALFRFTRPISGAYFWCPPLRDGQLDLSVLGM